MYLCNIFMKFYFYYTCFIYTLIRYFVNQYRCVFEFLYTILLFNISELVKARKVVSEIVESIQIDIVMDRSR